MSIYKIDEAILALIDPETGEIGDFEAFERLQVEKNTKIENMALWAKNLVSEAKAIREEEINLAERRKALENRAESLKKYLSHILNGQKFQTSRCSITFRKTTRVDLEDEALVVEWAQKNDREDLVKYTAPTINKTELAKVLKSDVEVPGASLVEGLSMGVK